MTIINYTTLMGVIAYLTDGNLSEATPENVLQSMIDDSMLAPFQMELSNDERTKFLSMVDQVIRDLQQQCEEQAP